jgi:hypothetical protein
MHWPDVVAWVLSGCTDLRLSQAKTLADLAGAAARVGRASPAALGRALAGPAGARHCGLLSDYPVSRGMARVLRGARYRRGDPVERSVVVR